METLSKILNYSFSIGESATISVKTILVIIIAFILTSIFLRVVRSLTTRKLPEDDKVKFITIFSYVKYFIFLIILLTILSANGIKVTAIITGAAALLLGIGLALQTFFQDIISGVFILMDQTLHVGDIIEMDGKVGRVTEIKLRTTRAVTIDNKVLIIPNHFHLTNTLYNWTQNGTTTRESVNVGVAYGSDVDLVKGILLQAAENVKGILDNPEPTVFFEDFGDSSLNFKLMVTLGDSFQAVKPKSDLRFEINRLFKEHNITIPFPQRDVHIYNK